MKYAIENGIIDLPNMKAQIEMSRRKELLSKHQYDIWLGKDGSWHTYIPDKTKKNNRRHVKRKSKEAVEDAVIEYLTRLTKNDLDKYNVSLKELFPEWIKYKSNHTDSSSYIKRITADWKKFYAHQTDFINKPLVQFTKLELDNWAHTMIKQYDMSKKQYYNMTVIIRQEFDFAVALGIIESNIFSEVDVNTKMFRKVKKKDGTTQVFMTDEIPQIVREMLRRFQNDPTDTTPLAVLLDFETGVRIGELVCIRLSDISRDFETLHIQRQEVRTFEFSGNEFNMSFSGFKIVEYTKSDDGDREIYLTDLAKKIIQLVLWTNNKYGYKCEDYLFVKGNKTINHYGVQSRILRGCESVGMITKTMHKIRKTYISSLIDSGLNIDEVRKQAGHSDERTTYGNYCYNRKTPVETKRIMEDALDYDDIKKVIKSYQPCIEEMPKIAQL